MPFARNAFDLIGPRRDSTSGLRQRLAKIGANCSSPAVCLVVSEMSWLRWMRRWNVTSSGKRNIRACPTVKENLRTVRDNGYELIDHFTLPEDAWWEPYYQPLEARLNMFREKYAGDEQRLQVVEWSQTEIEQYRKYSAYYGYVFYLLRRH
jgi:hypothetical protein